MKQDMRFAGVSGALRSLSRAGVTRLAVGAALAPLLCAASVSAAAAAQTNFTFDPASVFANADPSFTAANITVADYATINVDQSGNFIETGIVKLASFTTLAGGTVNTPNLNQTYALYVTFTGTGTQTGTDVITTSTGAFSTLSYSLMIATGTPIYSASAAGATITGVTGATTVAHGSLVSGTVSLVDTEQAGLSAGANVLATFVQDDPAFFDGTLTGLSLQFFTSVTNTGSVLSTANGNSELIINGGGGNATLQTVPEPASLAIIGVGLLGLGLAKRRRRG